MSKVFALSTLTVLTLTSGDMTAMAVNNRDNPLNDSWQRGLLDDKSKLKFEKTKRDMNEERNMWTQFEYGLMEGVLKVDRVGSESDCMSEGTELFQAWAKMLYKWALMEVEEGQDKNFSTVDGLIKMTTNSDFLILNEVFGLTYNLFYRCNYGATLQGIIFNKMVIDTMFFLPDFIPYWVKCILFFLFLIPLYADTLFDDILGFTLIYYRWDVHEDWFDTGIAAGKVLRMIFQVYLTGFMFYERMAKYWFGL